MAAISSQALDAIRETVGRSGSCNDPETLQPYLEEWRGLYRGATPLLVRPASTDEVSRVLAICNEYRIGVVPQGGNTGLCGGAVPDPSASEILLNLGRLNRIRDTDTVNNTITVEAGCVLADVQTAADRVGRLFPLSLAAEGSCQIGGNLSTNAGGVHVLRYGMMRDLTLGLEVVLADGRVWDGLRTLRKDTAGYDLKQVFIGAEGTLGIITAAVLRLFTPPAGSATAWVGLNRLHDLTSLHTLLQQRCEDTVNAFEFMPEAGLEMVLNHIPSTRRPLDVASPWHALIEVVSTQSQYEALEQLAAVLETARETNLISDGVVASSEAQRAALWRLRDSMSEAQKNEGASIKHDIAVPVAALAEFIGTATERVQAESSSIRVIAFGHAGDGNVHFNLSQPVGMDREAFLAHWSHFNRIIHDLVVSLGGTISAEHGIGQLKRDELARYKSDVELDLMRALKRALDPNGLMNPGKVIG